MLRKLPYQIITRPSLRIALAVVVIIAGLAPVGVPILSDNTSRQTAFRPDSPCCRIRTVHLSHEPRGRHDTGAAQRRPRPILARGCGDPATCSPNRGRRAGDEQTVVARSATSIWVSQDGGHSWTQSASLPSRPLSMVAGSKSTRQLLIGTESAGLLSSRDLGVTWQVLEDAALAGGGAAPLAITALAQNDEANAIVYAATAIWLGTSTARLTPVGVFASIDGGRHWLEVERSPLGAAPITELHTRGESFARGVGA